MKRIVLIDADIDLYQIALKNQIEIMWEPDQITMTSDLANAKIVFDAQVDGITKKVDADSYILCLSGENNFRKTNFPSYKGNRKDTRKPMGYKELKQYVIDSYKHQMIETLEADDTMGIIQTIPRVKSNVEYVIHSEDKDMWTIPGKIWCRKRNKIIDNSVLEADRFLFTQILTGDTADGYTGCPSVGKVKAEQVLKPCKSYDEMLTAVFKLYIKVYKDEDIAKEKLLEQARQARILRSTDYNIQSKEVILWNPFKEEVNGNDQTNT